MLCTHFGISGPLTLSASSHLGDMKTQISCGDRPQARSQRGAALRPHHAGFCPAGKPCGAGRAGKAFALQYAAGDGGTLGHRPGYQGQPDHPGTEAGLVQLMKHWRVSVDARGDLAHAVITSGGVSVREVDPKTMQSKKALGLYFCGRGAGCGCAYRRVQSADRLLHRTGICK